MKDKSRTKSKAIFYIIGIIMILAALIVAGKDNAKADNSGTCGTCLWYIENNVLYINPVDGDMGQGVLDTWEDTPPWYNYGLIIEKVVIGNGVTAVTCRRMFDGFKNCTDIQISDLDTSSVKDFHKMFNSCSKLENIYVDFERGGLHTENGIDLSYMFSGCEILESFAGNNISVSSAKDISYMFADCKAFEGLKVFQSWDTSNVENMKYLFFNCQSLDTLNISGWSTGKVKDMSSMFASCKNLNNVLVQKWNVSSLEDAHYMFSECDTMTEIDITGWNTIALEKAMGMFSSCDKLKWIKASGWNTSKVTTFSHIFQLCPLLEEIEGHKDFIVSSVTNFNDAFNGCKSLKNIDVSKWNTEAATQMMSTFGDTPVEIMDLSGWDFSGTAQTNGSVNNILYKCVKLKKIIFNGSVCKDSYNKIPSVPVDMVCFEKNGTPTYYEAKAPVSEGNGETRTYVIYKTVKFNPNGGKGEMDPQPFGFSLGRKTLSENLFTREGFVFAGWNTDPNGKGTSYTTESLLEYDDFEDGMVLYAQWKYKPAELKITKTWENDREDLRPDVTINISSDAAYLKAGERVRQQMLNSLVRFYPDSDPALLGNYVASVLFAKEEEYEAVKDSLNETDNQIQEKGAPVYMWCQQNSDRCHIYIYSEATTIYMNTDSSKMFSDFQKLSRISALSHFDTSFVTDMYRMFQGCFEITGEALSAIKDWNVKYVTDMGLMFDTAISLDNLAALRNWDVSNVLSLRSTFNKCNLTTLEPISLWDVSKVTDMYMTFGSNINLTHEGACCISGWDVRRVKRPDGTYLPYIFFKDDLVKSSFKFTKRPGNYNHQTYLYYLTDENGSTAFADWKKYCLDPIDPETPGDLPEMHEEFSSKDDNCKITKNGNTWTYTFMVSPKARWNVWETTNKGKLDDALGIKDAYTESSGGKEGLGSSEQNPIKGVQKKAEITNKRTSETDVYTVEYYYMKDGKYSDKPDSTDSLTGKSGGKVKVTEDQLKPQKAGFIFDENADNILEGMLDIKEAVVLKVYFKQAFTVTYAPGEQGTWDPDIHENVGYGADTPAFSGDTAKDHKAGYKFAGWNPEIEKTVTGDITYTALWEEIIEDDKTVQYTVEFYYQTDGEYPDLPGSTETRQGLTGQTVTLTGEDRTPKKEKYILDTGAENIFEGTLSANGDLVLKVYFAQQFDITFDPSGGTINESPDKVVLKAMHSETIVIIAAPERKGYKFLYWKGSEYQPGDAYTVDGDHTFTAQWELIEGGGGDTPKTGDNNRLLLFSLLSAVSAICFAAAYILKKNIYMNN